MLRFGRILLEDIDPKRVSAIGRWEFIIVMVEKISQCCCNIMCQLA